MINLSGDHGLPAMAGLTTTILPLCRNAFSVNLAVVLVQTSQSAKFSVFSSLVSKLYHANTRMCQHVFPCVVRYAKSQNSVDGSQ